jgi:ornithine cyclodeaminase
MRITDARSVARALPYATLIDALDAAFRTGSTTPDRIHHQVEVSDGTDGTLLLMPCWQSGQKLGVKIATVFPDNREQALPAVHASYLLMEAKTGQPVAVLDGGELTVRRTAAASALASKYLSRNDSETLLMVGTGRLAPHLITAHTTVRDIRNVIVWGRRREAAQLVADQLADAPYAVSVAPYLESAVVKADIISCATLAVEPLIMGDWLRTGQHLDLVGAYTPDRREADSRAVARGEVFVDTYAGALKEAGDIIQAMDEGAIRESDIRGDLSELVAGKCCGRSSDEAITLFKSVGTALEDLAAAELVFRSQNA